MKRARIAFLLGMADSAHAKGEWRKALSLYAEVMSMVAQGSNKTIIVTA